MMRTSSISSAGYSYAKTTTPTQYHHCQHHNQQQDSADSTATPLSPHHYSHLRSHSGTPGLPPLPLLSHPPSASSSAAATPTALVTNGTNSTSISSSRAPPIATTVIDPESPDSIVVVQRQASAPVFSEGGATAIQPHGRNSSAPSLIKRASSPGEILNGNGSISNPETADALSGVIDDISKMAQELDELFVEGMCVCVFRLKETGRCPLYKHTHNEPLYLLYKIEIWSVWDFLKHQIRYQTCTRANGMATISMHYFHVAM